MHLMEIEIFFETSVASLRSHYSYIFLFVDYFGHPSGVRSFCYSYFAYPEAWYVSNQPFLDTRAFVKSRGMFSSYIASMESI